MSEIENLKNEITRLEKTNETYYKMTTYVISLVMQIKTGDVSIDKALQDIKDCTSDLLWNCLYHTYISKDNLGVTSGHNLDYLNDEDIEMDNTENISIKE